MDYIKILDCTRDISLDQDDNPKLRAADIIASLAGMYDDTIKYSLLTIVAQIQDTEAVIVAQAAKLAAKPKVTQSWDLPDLQVMLSNQELFLKVSTILGEEFYSVPYQPEKYPVAPDYRLPSPDEIKQDPEYRMRLFALLRKTVSTRRLYRKWEVENLKFH